MESSKVISLSTNISGEKSTEYQMHTIKYFFK